MRPLPFLLALAVACAHEDDHDHDDTDALHEDTDAHEDVTLGDPETYTDGMEKDTKDGLFKVALTLNPAPHVGLHDVTLFITRNRMAGAPHTDAAVSLAADMPHHGHGTDPVTVVEQGDGTYTADDLNLMMAGRWRLSATIPGPHATDTIEWWFEVE